MSEIQRLEQQVERTRDYGMAISIFSNALLQGEEISEDELELVDFIIWKQHDKRVEERNVIINGCPLTPLED